MTDNDEFDLTLDNNHCCYCGEPIGLESQACGPCMRLGACNFTPGVNKVVHDSNSNSAFASPAKVVSPMVSPPKQFEKGTLNYYIANKDKRQQRTLKFNNGTFAGLE